jgi:hypothetical protein
MEVELYSKIIRLIEFQAHTPAVASGRGGVGASHSSEWLASLEGRAVLSFYAALSESTLLAKNERLQASIRDFTLVQSLERHYQWPADAKRSAEFLKRSQDALAVLEDGYSAALGGVSGESGELRAARVFRLQPVMFLG